MVGNSVAVASTNEDGRNVGCGCSVLAKRMWWW